MAYFPPATDFQLITAALRKDNIYIFPPVTLKVHDEWESVLRINFACLDTSKAGFVAEKLGALL